MKIILALLLSCFAFSAPAPNTKPALLVIDIQNFYFEGGYCPLTGSLEATKQAARAIEHFRTLSLPIIFIRHEGKFDPKQPDPATDPQYNFHPLLTISMCDPVISKLAVNSFQNTSLQETLKKLNVTSLVLVGMQTHLCLEAATRAATDFGFPLSVLTDAVATRTLKFDGVQVPAASVQAVVFSTLSEGYGTKLTTVDDYIKQNK